MKEKIKEILDKLQKVANRETASRNALMEMKDKDYQLLLDYITNLQEELFNEKERFNNYLIKEISYKQRNEKAIEYIIDNCVLSDEWKDLGFCNFIPTGRIEYKQLSKTKIKYLLNILKGDKDE